MLVQGVQEAIDAAADPAMAAVLARYFQVKPAGYGEETFSPESG